MQAAVLPASASSPILIVIISSAVLLLAGAGVVFWRLRNSNRRAHDAEQTLKTALNNISEGFVIFDGHGRLVMCNDRIKDMYPAVADQFVPGALFTDLHHELNANGPALACGETKTPHGQSEFEMCLGDGRWILHRDCHLPDGGMVGIRSDITSIKNRELALKDSEERYRDLVERSPVAIYVHRDNIMLYANSATANLLGYAQGEDLVGKNIFELIHPDHHKLALKRLEVSQEQSATLPQVDMKFRRADGNVIYTEAQVSPITYNGAPALESILRDVSQRRRTERALMESEQRYRNLFELAPDAILVHDGKKILFANTATAKLFGFATEGDLFDKDILDIIQCSPDDCVLLTKPLNTGNTGRVHACTLKRRNGQTFDAEVVLAPTSYHGHQVHQAVIRDVTERKRMDASVAQNAKLASLGGMAAGLAHELSQPLNIMRFAAEGGLLKMSKNKADDALHTKNYKLIQAQAERMGTIMDNMRIFSRKDPGPMTTFDLALAVRNISHLVRNPFRVEDVHIELKGPVSGIKARGNAIQLEQVLLNLLNNARDAILEHRQRHAELDEPGRITVKCAVSPKWDDAVITVQDNGGGIGEEYLARIFDPFFTTKEEGHGTGLGLALSHEIITAMSGTLSAQNKSNGACFTIRLPLVEATQSGTVSTPDEDAADLAAPLSAAAPGDDTPQNVRHVLVVEDEVEAARAMADFLEEEGFLVSIAHNGRDGLEAYRNLRPDIVVTDIRMPGMDGTGLIKALRTEQADLPIIAVTGHMSSNEEIDPGPGLKPVKIMQKPVSLLQLRREIAEA